MHANATSALLFERYTCPRKVSWCDLQVSAMVSVKPMLLAPIRWSEGARFIVPCSLNTRACSRDEVEIERFWFQTLNHFGQLRARQPRLPFGSVDQVGGSYCTVPYLILCARSQLCSTAGSIRLHEVGCLNDTVICPRKGYITHLYSVHSSYMCSCSLT